jgi:hypothetical protein
MTRARRGAIAALAIVSTVAATVAFQSQQPSPTIALLVETGPNWDTTKQPGEQRHFRTHSDNLRRLKEGGFIVAGGRFAQYGLILVRAPSTDSALSMMKPDSSIAVGTFKVNAHRWSTIYEGSITR